MRKHSLPALGSLWLALAATSAQAAETPTQCVTTEEASGLMLVIAPEAIKAVGVTCAAVLPANALVRQTSGPFIDKYRAEANGAWPAAKRAMGKISGPDAEALLETDQARPLITAMMAPMITKAIKPKDCGAIDHIVTLLAPLPARNTADLIVSIIQLDAADKIAKGEKEDLPICPAAKS